MREEAEIQKLLKAAYKAHKQNLKRERERLKYARIIHVKLLLSYRFINYTFFSYYSLFLL